MGSLLNNILADLIVAVSLIIVGFILAKLSNAFGTNRHIRKILNFSEDEDLLFVFPYREEQEILPRMAVEDSFAINNIVTLLMQKGWKGQIRSRNATHLSQHDRRKNIVTLGGPRVNPFTMEILEEMQNNNYEHYDPVFEFVENNQNPDHWQILRGNTGKYQSESHNVVNPGGAIHDTALIIKLTNPREKNTKVLVLAGIRGIGTWAAADHLRKNIDEIYKGKRGWWYGFRYGIRKYDRKNDRKIDFRKSGDFASIIRGTYKNLDIPDTKCLEFIDVS
jgi:hypothetical protein